MGLKAIARRALVRRLERSGAFRVVPAYYASDAFSVVPASQTWAFQWAETLRMLQIDMAFDVGANVGQWYQRFREAGFRCPVISFEPDPRAVQELDTLAHRVRDLNWKIEAVALGAASMPASTLYLWPLVSGSTSLKPVSAMGNDFTGFSNSDLGVTQVPVRRFDEVIDKQLVASKRALLKIDVQGFETEVLDGVGSDLLPRFAAIDIEIPLANVYQGSASFIDVLKRLVDLGFVPYTIQSERWHGEGYGVADCDVLLVNGALVPPVE